MKILSILTSCDVASNFARYDGLRYGYRPSVQEMNKEENESFESLLKKTRNHGFGQVVKGRVASGNYFLLTEFVFLILNQSLKYIIFFFQGITKNTF
jgi:aspartyl-tRNA(Asn)/glutamyl-tRNA(Gln) amidotransferase subunit A